MEMDGVRTILACLLWLAILVGVHGRDWPKISETSAPVNSTFANSTSELETLIVPGVKLCHTENGLSVNVKILQLLPDEENSAERTFMQDGKRGPLKKIRMALMMIPFFVQLISLPGAIATIKFSLLRSIFVAKLAIMMMLYSLLKNAFRKEQAVMVYQPQQHQHYYNHYEPVQYDDWLE